MEFCFYPENELNTKIQASGQQDDSSTSNLVLFLDALQMVFYFNRTVLIKKPDVGFLFKFIR